MQLFTCTSCNHQQRVPDDYVGKVLRCPQCSNRQILIASDEPDLPDSLFEDEPAVLQRKKFESDEQRGYSSLQARATSWTNTAHIVVTTADLKEDYRIIGPVYFQISNKGIFLSQLQEYVRYYEESLAATKAAGQLSDRRTDWGFLYGEWSAGQNDFDRAFFIAVEEMKLRAYQLGGDAIVGMRQDIDIDSMAFQWFYLQMYGTAVRIKPTHG